MRSPRFEPGSSAWQADVLDQTRLRPHDLVWLSVYAGKIPSLLLSLKSFGILIPAKDSVRFLNDYRYSVLVSRKTGSQGKNIKSLHRSPIRRVRLQKRKICIDLCRSSSLRDHFSRLSRTVTV